MLYHADDGHAEIAIEAASAQAAAQEYVDTGDWGPIDETTWIDVRVWPADGERRDGEVITIELEPDDPACTHDDGHDWQSPHEIVGGISENPGCWGHGGGVIIEEVCLHCGCARTTDTWAQRRDTGEQGLRSLRYEAGKYAEQVRALRERQS
jgi:hypothetical protein